MYVPLLNCILIKFYIYLFRIKYIVHRLFIFTYTFVIYKTFWTRPSLVCSSAGWVSQPLACVILKDKPEPKIFSREYTLTSNLGQFWRQKFFSKYYENQLSRIHLAVQIEEQFVVEVKVCEAGIDHRDDCQPYRLCFLDRIIMSKEIKNQIGY